MFEMTHKPVKIVCCCFVHLLLCCELELEKEKFGHNHFGEDLNFVE